MVNQPGIVVVYNHKKTAVVVDVAMLRDLNIRKKELKKLEKYQGLKEEMKKMLGVKAAVGPFVIGALGALMPNLGVGGSSRYQDKLLRSLSR